MARPPPTRLVALTSPPSASTLRRTIQRPSPECGGWAPSCGRPRGKIALENVIDLLGGDARALVLDPEFDRVASLAQGDGDRAAARREADGIFQNVLQYHLQHALAGAHVRPIVEMADQADVAAREDLAEIERRLADKVGEVGRYARRLDQVGGAVVEALRGVDQSEQADERGIDDLDARRARCSSAGTALRTGDSDDWIAASGVLKACALSSADWRICCDRCLRSSTSLSKSRATLDSRARSCAGRRRSRRCGPGRSRQRPRGNAAG